LFFFFFFFLPGAAEGAGPLFTLAEWLMATIVQIWYHI